MVRRSACASTHYGMPREVVRALSMTACVTGLREMRCNRWQCTAGRDLTSATRIRMPGTCPHIPPILSVALAGAVGGLLDSERDTGSGAEAAAIPSHAPAQCRQGAPDKLLNLPWHRRDRYWSRDECSGARPGHLIQPRPPRPSIHQLPGILRRPDPPAWCSPALVAGIWLAR